MTDKPNVNPIVTETQDLFQRYSTAAQAWRKQAQEDAEFRMGRQWTSEQEAELQARGQAAIVINRIHPAVETAKALLTANRPSFRTSPREDSDNKVAQVFNGLLEYVYQISDGPSTIGQIVDDYYVKGMGVLQVYQDPLADMGKGEVKIVDLDPLDVYVDPDSRNRFCDDAENIIVSRLFTKEQAKKLYPLYRNKIANATGTYDQDAPLTNRVDTGNEHFFKFDVGMQGDQDYLRGYERYTKIYQKEYRIYEYISGNELLLDEVKYQEYLLKTIGYYNGVWLQTPAAEQMALQQVEMAKQRRTQLYGEIRQDTELKRQELNITYSEQSAQIQQAAQAQQISPDRAQLEITKLQDEVAEGLKALDTAEVQQLNAIGMEGEEVKKFSYAELIQQKMIQVVEIYQCRIKLYCIVGDELLYERVLPIEKYPIIFFMNLHNRTPYPTSDVRIVKPIQEYINKTQSLIIAHATTSSNTKLLIPNGSMDLNEVRKNWAVPNAVMGFDAGEGQPIVVQPSQLPVELFQSLAVAKQEIEYELGLFALMMGEAGSAPATFKATVSIDEFGQRRSRSKLRDIEAGLCRAGEVIIPLAQELYKTEKVIRLLNPNNSMSEFAMNQRLYDDKTNEIHVINDITRGRYDVIVVAGSTLPTNRYAMLEIYLNLYREKIIDQVEVLKKTEVFDMEGVLQRTSQINQLTAELEQAQAQIKQLSGDMQTKDRELGHLQNRVDAEKFRSDLEGVRARTEASGRLYDARLQDTLSNTRENVNRALRDQQKRLTSDRQQSRQKKPRK